MRTSGAILQIIAVATIAFGTLFGVLQLASKGGGDAAIQLIAGGVVGGLILYGVGGAFVALSNIAADARRAADALELLSQRRRANERPPDPSP